MAYITERFFIAPAYPCSAASRYNLTSYAVGAGVPVNNVKAYMWLSLAKAQGDETAVTGLDIVKKQMTPSQIAKAQALATDPKR